MNKIIEAQERHYHWQLHSALQRFLTYLSYLGVGLVMYWAIRTLEVEWLWVLDAPTQIGDLLGRMTPPNVSRSPEILRAMIDTINIATLATVIAIGLSLPVAYISAQNTTPNVFALWLGRLILVSTRSVNTIIWALLFVAIFGPGPVAGILAIAFRSIGFTGKLIAEAIEEIDHNQVEAMTATGASKSKVLLFGVIPQIMPAFLSVSILRWDINIRESTVLGLVGAGGIGLLLQGAINTFAWPVVATILLAIIIVVILAEIVASWLRSKVI